MNARRRDAIAIWALAALCVVLSALLVASVVNSFAAHPRRAFAGDSPSSGPAPAGPTATPTPSPSGSPDPDPGGGSGGGTGTGGGGSAGGTGIGGGSVDQPSPAYTISGTLAQQLHPGDVFPLDLVLSNLGSASMTAIELHVSISHVTAPNATVSHPCTVNDFTAVQPDSALSISLAGFESASLSGRAIPSSQWPQIGMTNTAANQDGCKGATLTLTFSGSSAVTP